MIVEGIHLVPGYIEPSQFEGARVVQLVIAVDDEEAHRSHFYIRDVRTEGRRAFEKYKANFDNIRQLGSYIEGLAHEHGTPIVHSLELDATVAQTLEWIVSEVTGEPGPQTGRIEPKDNPGTEVGRTPGKGAGTEEGTGA
jgi:2-phosphoglycerate kinase